ncbi:MAG: secondary thiamine-phosphate synthase enzyme YjbQ [Methanolobus sp.]|uniref:secondary thiamine-phosphate synthase enzyme YjbQ n=1 Tax=Methanolobus sp. TaxID=1874737 RepID=UPI002730E044|nr:secondary thiamine-phosphate synthase enzyme YjbQ [Methanolobus sp.]MDP2216129.1 secondary thiamine-phosphate synthase enzyme YjbQ [Methanolobus sp.]
MQVNTSKRTELIDITDHVKKHVTESGIQNGICIVSTMHTTTAIIINENEPGLVTDILTLRGRIVPEGAGYQHDRIDNNADAHLRAVLLGNSESIPIRDGRLVLGTWQSIFLAELDGPRKRTVDITVIGRINGTESRTVRKISTKNLKSRPYEPAYFEGA